MGFSKDNNATISSFRIIIPKSYFKYDSPDEEILDASQKYESDLPTSIEILWKELCSLKELWKKKFEKSDKYYTMFLNIECLLKTLCIIRFTTTTSERSFSSLKRIKTYLRSTMNQNKLNGVTMLHINKDIAVKCTL